MAIGSSLTGTRSATCTSGPGFALMAECLSWAGINEISVVITLYQRSGPSTGLPTRHGQDDLLFAIHAGVGEFPRIVMHLVMFLIVSTIRLEFSIMLISIRSLSFTC